MKRGIQPVDIQIGLAIRSMRLFLGMTQADLACRVGTSLQQLQKYEHGINRIAASRLVAIAAALECHISQLFEAVEPEASALAQDRLGANALALAAKIARLPPNARRAVEDLLLLLSEATAAPPRPPAVAALPGETA